MNATWPNQALPPAAPGVTRAAAHRPAAFAHPAPGTLGDFDEDWQLSIPIFAEAGQLDGLARQAAAFFR